MPLFKIDLIKNARSPTELRHLADTIYSISRTHFAAPDGDRYQIITQHEPYELICADSGLGYTRSDKLVFIQVFQQGRDAGQKQALYKALAEELGKECGLRGEDLIVTCVENGKEDWSFGEGRAQFLDGGLPIKK